MHIPDLALARQLSDQIIAARDRIEAERRIPTELCQRLDSAGLYRLYVPQSLGGYELSPLATFEIIEELSKADGSVGWCLMNANGIGLATGWLPPDSGAQIGPSLRAAGSLRPLGQAWPVEGGFRVRGRWNFASGLHNANWLFCPCTIMEGDAPRLGPAGTPATRTMWIPASEAEPVDTWSVVGLRGTGSDDFVVADRFVPNGHGISIVEKPQSGGALYQSRLFISFFYALFAAHSLGIARASISAVTGMAENASNSSQVALRDRPFVHSCLGQAEAITNAARSYVIDYLGRLWETACQGNAGDLEIAHFRLAVTHAINEALRTVDAMFHTAGTHAIYTLNSLERQFRDVHVAVQHYAASPVHYESAGRVLVGLRPAASELGW